MDAVTELHAVFGGELALAFFLRDAAYLPTHLEIFVSHSEFEAMCDTILDDSSICA